MEIERIKQTMESFGTYSMCINCSKCDRSYHNVSKDGMFEVDYSCKGNDNRNIAHPRMHCNKWEPNTNMQILFGRERVQLTPSNYQIDHVEKTEAEKERDRLARLEREKAAYMHGLGETYQKMHDQLKRDMEDYDKIEPLEVKVQALQSLIDENANPQYLPHYQQQLDEATDQLQTVYQEYEEMEARLKELYDKAQHCTYYTPALPQKQKEAFTRPQTMMEGVAEDMPTREDIFLFLHEDHINERVQKEVRKAVAFMVARRNERERLSAMKAASNMRAKAKKEAKAKAQAV